MYLRSLWVLLAVMSLSAIVLPGCNNSNKEPAILVFSKTDSYYHRSVTDGMNAIQKLGSQNSFLVDTTTNAAYFNEDSLKKYAAVVFLSTTGDVLDNYQEAAFERYIQAGGGYVGIHAAADTERDWGWYGRLVGGILQNSQGINDTFPVVQSETLRVQDPEHPATKQLPGNWKWTDELYSFTKLADGVKLLLTSEGSGADSLARQPVAWSHEFDGGRAFYTALGHAGESFSDSTFLNHILGGIQYAIGKNKKLDYSKAKTFLVPDEARFAKTMLVTGQLFEPTEMTILPNLDILIGQRRGEIMLYKNGDSLLKPAGFLNVYYRSAAGGNVEEGLLGLKADPNFEKNHYIFIFYSPADSSVNRLSRFKFENDKIDSASEKIILQFYSQREICCHTGGSIAFDKDGLLYVSTGDNSTPFDEPDQKHVSNGYAPLDQRPGHEQYDARRSSGNPNDLRGKILRIRVNEDGSYDIPEGNLYPKNTPGTRPEIYVQGNRNPYRISVDQRTGYLYWGEVGPDAGKDSANRGPRGYDEVNQARKAGFFGWPLFVGNNYPYYEYDYGTGETGQPFNSNHPVNNSRNNTGKMDLPPAQPAFIWYPYGASVDFPQTGSGGRTAMAGPVYYTDMFPKKTRLPDYYNNKLFIYDWVRNWIKVVTMLPNGDFDKMEPFIAATKLNAVSDMEVGPDGKIYLLEYGNGWYSKNADAGLSRIDFNSGNMAPVVTAVKPDKLTGSLPFTVRLEATASDPEKDPLTYTWNLGNGVVKKTNIPVLEHQFDKAGDYEVYVKVADNNGGEARSQSIHLYAGNEAPVIDISVSGNSTFYFPGRHVVYKVLVRDKEEGDIVKDAGNVLVNADYLEGGDVGEVSAGHQVLSDAMAGKILEQTLDCKSCHKQNEQSIGPSFLNVAKKYKNDSEAPDYLADKIIKGGGGVWGETVMSAHPDLSRSDAKLIVSWILSLGSDLAQKPSLPLSGSLSPTLNKELLEDGRLVISASYTDKGGQGIRPLTGYKNLVLRSGKFGVGEMAGHTGFVPIALENIKQLLIPAGKGAFWIDNIDLTDLTRIDLTVGGDMPPSKDYDFELRLDNFNGPVLGSAKLPHGVKNIESARSQFHALIPVNMRPVTDGRKHTIYVISRSGGGAEKSYLTLRGVELRAD